VPARIQGETLHRDPCTVSIATKAKALTGLAGSVRGPPVRRL